MSRNFGYTTTYLANEEDTDPNKVDNNRWTKAHYRRVKKFCTSTSPPVQNYQRCGYNAGFTPDAEGMYSFGFIGAPENGTFKNFYDVCNMCLAEDHSEEFVVQFLREKLSSYVNMAVTFVKGLSEKHDGSVVFDGGQHSRDYEDGTLHKCTVEDERFEIGMKIDFTWGFDYSGSHPKVVKCNGLCFDMPGFQMEIVGNFDASKNQHWDDKSRDFFNQTFNFRLDEGSEECYIRFARNHQKANEIGDYTIVTRDFRQRLANVGGSNGIDLDFTVRHRSKQEPQAATTEVAAPQREYNEKSLTEPPVEEDSGASSKREPSKGKECSEPQEKEIRFFDHPEHKLLLQLEHYDKDHHGATCNACTESFQRTQWVYSCANNGNGCDYAVHAACAQFPRTFQHPSHAKHTVELRKLAPWDCKLCDVCKEDIVRGLHYHCAMCDFDAHPLCPGDHPRQASVEAPVGESVLDPPQEAPKAAPVGASVSGPPQEAPKAAPVGASVSGPPQEAPKAAPVGASVSGPPQEAPKAAHEWDPSQHLGMTREQYLAYQTQKLQQQRRLQAMQLEQARWIASVAVGSARAMSNLVGGPKTCYKGCWPGYCTC